MKLTIILMTAALLQVSAGGRAQTINFSGKNVSIKTVFSAIEKQTDYVFFYDARLLHDAKPITINVKDALVENVLKEMFTGKPLGWEITDKTITILKKPEVFQVNELFKKLFTKDITIKGKVTNQKGEALGGATIKVTVKDKSIILTANSDGSFSIEIPDTKALITVSYVGYKTKEIKFSGKESYLTIRLELKEANMEDITVAYSTGYQTLPKERATGSFSTISAKEIEKRTSPNLLERIEGQVSGVLVNVGQPDRSLIKNRDNFTIRGVSTINSEQKPLIVLNGFPTEIDLVNINPSDVENITFLKDAAAASIWGIRAANGVIVIETKKGKFSSSPQVSYSSIFTFTGKPRLDYLPLLKSADYLSLEKEMVDKGMLPLASSPLVLFPTPLTTGAQLYLQLKAGTISQQEYDRQIAKLSTINVNNQYQEYILQSPFAQQHNIAISGGSATSRSYFSASYTDEQPNAKNNFDNRLTINFSNETRISDRLTFSAESFVSILNQKNNGLGLQGLQPGPSTLLPYDQLVNDVGIPNNFSYQFTANVLDSLQTQGFLPWKYNYINEMANADNTEKSLAYRLSGGLNYKIMPGFMSVDLKYMMEKSYDKIRNYYNLNTYYARDIINTYTDIGTHENGIPIGGILNQIDMEQNNYNLRGQVNLSPNFGDNHQLNAIIGAEIRQTVLSGNGDRAYGYDDRLLTSTEVSYTTKYKTVFGSQPVPFGQTFMNREDRYASFFANFTYMYKSKYSLSGSLRKDNSNLFGSEGKSNNVPLYSLGAKWRLKEEGFMQNISWVSDLNARATFGYNGNINKTNSPYLIISPAGSNQINSEPYANVINPANPRLSPERVKTFNVGTDFSLFNYRLNGSIDAYWRRSLELLGQVATNPTYGFTSLYANQLEMSGRGVDIELHGNVIKTLNFQWTPSINFSYNTNKVTKTFFQQSTTNYYTNPANPIEGKALGSIYTYRFAGLNDHGNAMIYNGEGKSIYADDRNFDNKDISALAYKGVTSPPYFGGFANTFTYGNFELYTLFTFKAGHKFIRPSVQDVYALPYTRVVNKDYAKRWKVPGDELHTNFPSIDPLHPSLFRYVQSELFVEDASYIRWRDITLTYKIPVQNLKWGFVKTIDFSITGRNMAIWTANKYGIDPDYIPTNTTVSLPPSKSLVLSLRASF